MLKNLKITTRLVAALALLIAVMLTLAVLAQVVAKAFSNFAILPVAWCSPIMLLISSIQAR